MSVRLKRWINSNPGFDKRRKVFYNMSKTMKYIHSKGYCIKTFNPNEIRIIDENKLSPIQYNTLIKPKPNELEKMRQEDIYNLAFLQIGIYADMINVLRPEFLKEKFQEFEIFLHEDDIPYYKGIVIRNAHVYYSDYIDTKNERDIAKLREETGANKKISSHQKTKSTASGRAMVDKETKRLYSPIDKPEAAYVSFLILPIAMIILGIVLSLIALFK